MGRICHYLSALGELMGFRHQAGQTCNCFGVNCASSSRRLYHSSRRQSRGSKNAEAGDAQHAAVDTVRRGESRDRRELLGDRLHQSKSERTGPRTAEEIRQAYGRPRQHRSTSTVLPLFPQHFPAERILSILAMAAHCVAACMAQTVLAGTLTGINVQI